MTHKPIILRNNSRRNNTPSTVKTQHQSWISSSNVRNHAVTTVQAFAPLTLLQTITRENPAADSALILESCHLAGEARFESATYQSQPHEGILTFSLSL